MIGQANGTAMKDVEQTYQRVGTCLNCGRAMYGYVINGKSYAEECECEWAGYEEFEVEPDLEVKKGEM
jgi:hypothetical protein